MLEPHKVLIKDSFIVVIIDGNIISLMYTVLRVCVQMYVFRRLSGVMYCYLIHSLYRMLNGNWPFPHYFRDPAQLFELKASGSFSAQSKLRVSCFAPKGHIGVTRRRTVDPILRRVLA